MRVTRRTRLVCSLAVAGAILMLVAPGVRAQDNTLYLDCTGPTTCPTVSPILTHTHSPTFNIHYVGADVWPPLFASTTVAVMVPDTLAGAGSLNFFVNMGGTILSAVGQGLWTAADPANSHFLTDFLNLTLHPGHPQIATLRNPALGNFLPFAPGATGFYVYLATVNFWMQGMAVSFCSDAACMSSFSFGQGTWFHAFTRDANGVVVDAVPSEHAVIVAAEPASLELLASALVLGLFIVRRSRKGLPTSL